MLKQGFKIIFKPLVRLVRIIYLYRTNLIDFSKGSNENK